MNQQQFRSKLGVIHQKIDDDVPLTEEEKVLMLQVSSGKLISEVRSLNFKFITLMVAVASLGIAQIWGGG